MGVSRKAVSTVAGVIAVVVVAMVVGLQHGGGHAGSSAARACTPASSSSSSIGWIRVSTLPSQARQVLDEIDHGGPFEYPGKDGAVFGNYEHLLPQEPVGCYHEYTVDTPGASSRGTRRIITGPGGELYWTADHYESFQRIRR